MKRLQMLKELKDELYLDVQGPGASAEQIAELIAKISTGVLIAYFSLHELFDELQEYKALRKSQRKDPNFNV